MSKTFRLRGLDPVFFVSHILLLGICYSVYLAPQIAPSTFGYFGFIPIVFPILLGFDIILILLLFFRRPVYAFLLFILSIGLYPAISTSYQYFGEKKDVAPDFKMITLNGHHLKENDLINFFKKEKPDLVMLQEVYWRTEKFQNLRDSAFENYYHEKNSIIQVLSKYPIIEFQKIFSGEDKTTGCAAYADIDTGKDTIRVINVYMESMLIDKSLVMESLETENTEENSKVIKNKLIKGFIVHEKQLKKILPYIKQSKHPVIVAGDFNSVPNSYEYEQINHFLNDAYEEVGRSAGTTFHEFKFPLRLDYIFHSEFIEAVRVDILKEKRLSDHYPVVGYFKLP